MTRLKLLMQRIFTAFSIKNKSTASGDTAIIPIQIDGSDQLFDIKPGGIWSDDVASPVRGGKRYRENERFRDKSEITNPMIERMEAKKSNDPVCPNDATRPGTNDADCVEMVGN